MQEQEGLDVKIARIEEQIKALFREMRTSFDEIKQSKIEDRKSINDILRKIEKLQKRKAEKEDVEKLKKRLEEQEQLENERRAVFRAFKWIIGAVGASNIALILQMILGNK